MKLDEPRPRPKLPEPPRWYDFDEEIAAARDGAPPNERQQAEIVEDVAWWNIRRPDDVRFAGLSVDVARELIERAGLEVEE